MAKQWKRWSILLSLTAAFFIFIFSLTSCNLAETAGDGLTNAIGAQENGPGSGKWVPPKPQNIREARQLHNILETLSNNGTELSISYDKLYGECFDATGKLLPGKESEDCTIKVIETAKMFRNHVKDFLAGVENYNTWAQDGDEKDPPAPPDPPKEPENPPPETEDPEDNDETWGCPPFCCLTCIQNLDLEYMYAPFRSELH